METFLTCHQLSIYKHTRIRTHKHTYEHTYIHTHIQTWRRFWPAINYLFTIRTGAASRPTWLCCYSFTGTYWRMQNNCSSSDRFITVQCRIFALSVLFFENLLQAVTCNAEKTKPFQTVARCAIILHTPVCMYVRMYVSTYSFTGTHVCMYVCTYVNIYMHRSGCNHAGTCKHLCAYVCIANICIANIICMHSKYHTYADIMYA